MRKTTKLIAAGVSTIALAGGIGVSLASADPSTSPTPSASPTSNASPSTKRPKAERKLHRDLTKRALHGEVTLGGQNPRVVVFQRGTVDTVSTTSISVTSKDGYTATYVVAESTKIRQAKEEIAAGDIKAADQVRIRGTKTGETTTATRIVVVAR